MREYIPENTKDTPAWRILLKLLLGVFLVFVSIWAHSIWGVIVAVLVLGAAFMKKATRINQDGICTKYNFLFFKFEDKWKFEDIEYIHKEYGSSAGYLTLHFLRGYMSKKYLFRRSQAMEIIDMAKSINPNIKVENAK